MSFRLDGGISWDDFSDSELELIHEDLVTAPGHRRILGVGGACGSIDDGPRWVVRLLQERIEFAEGLDSLREYDALPHSWDKGLRIRDTPAFLSTSHRRRSGLDRGEPGLMVGARRRSLRAVAVRYDSQVLDLLGRASRRHEKFASSCSSGPPRGSPDFDLGPTDFVRIARARGRQAWRRRTPTDDWGAVVRSHLRCQAGRPERRFRTIEQRDRSRAIAGLAGGSIERRFYADMAKSAERNVQREIEMTLPTDGRYW